MQVQPFIDLMADNGWQTSAVASDLTKCDCISFNHPASEYIWIDARVIGDKMFRITMRHISESYIAQLVFLEFVLVLPQLMVP